MLRRSNAWCVLIGVPLLAGCSIGQQKSYVCHGEMSSYRTNEDFRVVRFDDFTLVLSKQMSFSAFIQGEAMYKIEANGFSTMYGISDRHQVVADDQRFDLSFRFNLISKKMLFSAPNSHRMHDWYEGVCVASQL